MRNIKQFSTSEKWCFKEAEKRSEKYSWTYNSELFSWLNIIYNILLQTRSCTVCVYALRYYVYINVNKYYAKF